MHIVIQLHFPFSIEGTVKIEAEYYIPPFQFVTGKQTVKKESVAYYVKSKTHQNALSIKAAKEKRTFSIPGPIEMRFQRMEAATLNKMEKLFRTAYYLALNERPFLDFDNILELQDLNGISVGQTYRNDK